MEEKTTIYDLFIKNHYLSFTEIRKALDLRSNHVDYYLKKMIQEGIVKKEKGKYKLTTLGEKELPFYSQKKAGEKGPLNIVVVAIMNKEKICLLKREKRPYKDYWGLIGGKIKLEESIPEAAIREAEEETGLQCTFKKIRSILHERVKEDGIYKHAFTIFLCEVSAEQIDLTRTDEGNVEWFHKNRLPKNTILSDKKMIKDLLQEEKIKFYEGVIEKEEEKLKSIKFKQYDAKN